LADIAKNNKWQIEYDSDVDSLYWSKPRISKKTQLMKLSEDFALYVAPNGNIEGIFIEYAKNNFVEHNEDFRPIFENLEKIDENRFTLSKEKQKEFSGLLESMANKISSKTLSNVLENNLSIKHAFQAVPA
jgi:uncharacterized protein YuzE